MDDNSSPESGIDGTVGISESAKASSLMRTLSFLSSKYAKEIAASVNYDEKNDRKYQREMKELAKEKQIIKSRELSKNSAQTVVY
jgi:hypothetical protein